MPQNGFDRRFPRLLLFGLLGGLMLSPLTLCADVFAPEVAASVLELHLPSHMAVSQRDNHQWVVLETGKDKGNQVERRTTRYSDGNKAIQVTEVLSPLAGEPPLYVGKKHWDRSGVLVATLRENHVLDDAGVQVGGVREADHLENGRVVRQEVEDWNPSLKGWLVTVSRVMTYYSDGDLKERVTENIPDKLKTDERWGAKREGKGRAKTLRRWDAAAKAWKPS